MPRYKGYAERLKKDKEKEKKADGKTPSGTETKTESESDSEQNKTQPRIILMHQPVYALSMNVCRFFKGMKASVKLVRVVSKQELLPMMECMAVDAEIAAKTSGLVCVCILVLLLCCVVHSVDGYCYDSLRSCAVRAEDMLKLLEVCLCLLS